jgi:hypothetical protein
MANGNATDRSVAKKRPNALGKTNQDDAHVGMIAHETKRRRHGHGGPVVPSHAVDSDGNAHRLTDKRKGRQLTIRESYLPNPEKSLARTLDDFLAPIKTRGADMMPQMNLASRRLDSQRRAGQRIMRTMHTTLGWGFLVLLNSHN